MSMIRTRTQTHASRNDLLTILYAPLVASECRQLAPLQEPPIDRDMLHILAADVLEYPLSGIDVLAQCGRFVHIAYKPVLYSDPDIILCYDKGAAPFHAAVRRFQLRRTPRADWAAWYAATKDAAHGLITPLLRLDAHPAEAEFVLRWALMVCASGKTV